MQKKKMRILYGGAFNPPTIAHYEVIKYLISKFFAAEIIVMPSCHNYKENIADQHRYNMIKIIVDSFHNEMIKVSDYEIKLGKYVGTYYTLKVFDYPYFVMGADQLVTIDKWICYPDIVKENKFIILPRNNVDIYKVIHNNPILKVYSSNFIIANDFVELNVSSTQFRNTINENIVTDDVFTYIKENKLYGVN